MEEVLKILRDRARFFCEMCIRDSCYSLLFLFSSVFSNESNSNLILRFFFDNCGKFLHAHCAKFWAVILINKISLTNRNRSCALLFFSENKHIRNFLELCLSDFIAKFLVAVIDFYTNAACFECFSNLFCVICKFVGYRKNFCLYRC